MLYSLDILGATDAYTPAAREAISRRWGIPVESVVLAATHTHSGPDTNQHTHPAVSQYIEMLIQRLVELGGKALDDRHDALMEWTTTQNEGMNYVRHYILENDTVCGDNFGDPRLAPYRCHVSEADREIRIVKITRQGAKDILLVNWQAHPTMASTSATEHGRANRPYISADYVGACRNYLEEKTDMHFIYFQGAAGNINSRSRMESEQDTRDHIVYGQQLGDYILQGMKRLQPLDGGKVAATTGVLRGKLNHSEDHLVPAAEKIYAQWRETNDYRHCADMAKPYGIHSPYHAGSILNRAKLADTMDITLGAGRVGALGFAILPYEVFDTNGLQIREASPFALTLIISCANGRYNYFPSAQAFAHGCYEADMCKLAPGVGEKGAQTALELLNELHREG